MAANSIPFSGALPESGGYLLPEAQGALLTNGVLQETGVIRLAGDARTTNARKEKFPIWTGMPTAGPVGEGGRKPVTGGSFDQTEMNVKKFASIVVFTDEQIEDVQSGDLNVLVDSGVRKALAVSIDAHVAGKEAGANITTVFDTALRSTAAPAVQVDLAKADGLQKAISAAMGILEGNGYGDPSQMGVALGFGFQQLLRDAQEDDQTTAASQRRLYGGNDPLYGLDRVISTNLNATSAAAGASNIIGFVVHKPNIHVRLRHDVRVKVDQSASLEVPDGAGGTKTVHLFQDNLTAIRYELRLAHMVHDLSRAVVPLTRKA